MPLRRLFAPRRLRRLAVLVVGTGGAMAWRDRKVRQNQQRFGLP